MAKEFRTGARVQTKHSARLYNTEDPPTAAPVGSVTAGEKGDITLGPHMGKSYVRFDNQQSGWVSNGDLVILS